MASADSVVIFGVGQGLGSAIARRFAQSHPVAVVARKGDVVGSLARDIGGKAYVADAGDGSAITGVFDAVERELGPIGCAISNLSLRVQKPFMETTPEDFERAFRVNGMGAFRIAHEAARRMLPRGRGSIFFTGGRTSIHSVANLAVFGFNKSGVRHLAGTLHNELGPRGIHVAHFSIDGGIDNERTRAREPERAANDGLAGPDAIAELYYQTHLQPRHCWTVDIECRPWIEPV